MKTNTAVSAARTPAPPKDNGAAAAPVPVAAPHSNLEIAFLGGLFLFAFIGTLIIARPALVPMTAAALLAMTLMPAVNRLRQWGMPHVIAVTIVAIAVAGGAFLLAWLLVEPLGNALNALPLLDGLGTRLARLGRRVFGGPYTAWVTDRLREAAAGAALGPRLFASVGEAVVLTLTTLVLTLFLLLSGNLFLQKLVRVLPRIRDKVKAVQVVHSVQEDVSRYLGTVTLINVVMGTFAGLIATYFELPAPLLIGVLVALINYAPYVGGVTNVLLLLLASAAVYGGLGEAIVPPAIYMVLAIIEGQLVTPLIVGRRTQLNAVTVVFGLVFWAWVWGIPGLALAIPLLLVLKGFATHIERLEAVSEFMGR
jgi:predicted PurR-regulated permease PerM